MTPSAYDPFEPGGLSLDGPCDPREQVDLDNGSPGPTDDDSLPAKVPTMPGYTPSLAEPTASLPERAPTLAEPTPTLPEGTPTPPERAPARPNKPALSQPQTPIRGLRQGSAAGSDRREPLPSQRDRAAYAKLPAPEPVVSRLVPGVMLLVGLGAALYIALVVRHYPLAIFLMLFSFVAAPLTRLVLQEVIE